VAARQESGPNAATPGKRRYGLVVQTTGGHRPSFRRVFIRNIVKIGVPWQIGHASAIGAAFGGFEHRDPVTLGATSVTYPLLAALIVNVAIGDGWALHDRIAGSSVTSAKTTRKVSSRLTEHQ